MRAPGMKLMDMPIFTWTSLCTAVLIIASFPVLTGTLVMLTLDRYLTVLRYAGELQYDKYTPKIEQALMEVIMKYMMHNPE